MNIYRCYLDRIEDNQYAVLIVDELNREYIMPVDQLPENAEEGTRGNVQIEDDKAVSFVEDKQATVSAKDRISQKKELLKKKKRSEFKR
ncbi:DUF3006 family protein [Alkalicoccus daliensis]|uniref:DUF3006 domain-containing protein n=1 Tax=Alkalicoccus daliensis TaxID=745820 RepID=A0A1G9ZMT6_9BACI|nr:DUF3006 family protein [Alkalicoccus daliensis]SDN22669.1 Protein of unknown function [Alkalicoccus daliensis]